MNLFMAITTKPFWLASLHHWSHVVSFPVEPTENGQLMKWPCLYMSICAVGKVFGNVAKGGIPVTKGEIPDILQEGD